MMLLLIDMTVQSFFNIPMFLIFFLPYKEKYLQFLLIGIVLDCIIIHTWYITILFFVICVLFYLFKNKTNSLFYYLLSYSIAFILVYNLDFNFLYYLLFILEMFLMYYLDFLFIYLDSEKDCHK